MVEGLRVEVDHSPSNPTTHQKVRFFAEVTGHVSKVEIVIRWLYAHSRLKSNP